MPKPMCRKNNVLLLEDNPADAELTRLALEGCPHPIQLQHFSNGEDFVRRFGEYPSESIACMILDLNVPKINGLEVLRRLRAEPRFQQVPAVIFSSSDLPEDINASYAAGADAYMVKPDSFDEFCDTVSNIIQFWLSPLAMEPALG
jgi:CheY-like chemotaxis protein